MGRARSSCTSWASSRTSRVPIFWRPWTSIPSARPTARCAGADGGFVGKSAGREMARCHGGDDAATTHRGAAGRVGACRRRKGRRLTEAGGKCGRVERAGRGAFLAVFLAASSRAESVRSAPRERAQTRASVERGGSAPTPAPPPWLDLPLSTLDIFLLFLVGLLRFSSRLQRQPSLVPPCALCRSSTRSRCHTPATSCTILAGTRVPLATATRPNLASASSCPA